MSASDVINAPITITVAGKKYKVRRLSVLKILACAEDYILRQCMRRVRAISDGLAEADRAKAITDETAKIPSGEKLAAEARKLMLALPDEVAASILWTALQTDQPALTLEEAALIFADATPAEMEPTMRVITGKSSAPAQTSTGRSRKRTTGRRK